MCSGCLWLHMCENHIDRQVQVYTYPQPLYHNITVLQIYLYIRIKAISIILDANDEPLQFPAVRKCSNRKGWRVSYIHTHQTSTYNIIITQVHYSVSRTLSWAPNKHLFEPRGMLLSQYTRSISMRKMLKPSQFFQLVV